MHKTEEFALTRDDLKRFQRIAWRRLGARNGLLAPPMTAKLVLWLLIASSLFISFQAAERHPAEALRFYLLAALTFIAILFASVMPSLGSARGRALIVTDRGAFLRPHRLEFTDATFAVAWATGRAEQQWSDFIARDADAVNHYLYVDGFSATIVPRRVVEACREDFERCVASIASA